MRHSRRSPDEKMVARDTHVQHIDRIVDVPVVMRHQVPTRQTVQKMVEVLKCQYLDRVVDVVMQRQSSTIPGENSENAVTNTELVFYPGTKKLSGRRWKNGAGGESHLRRRQRRC